MKKFDVYFLKKNSSDDNISDLATGAVEVAPESNS